jgi:hypothetical protein
MDEPQMEAVAAAYGGALGGEHAAVITTLRVTVAGGVMYSVSTPAGAVAGAGSVNTTDYLIGRHVIGACTVSVTGQIRKNAAGRLWIDGRYTCDKGHTGVWTAAQV